MRVARFKQTKELEIVSLIDVVFLLIIFGIVISVFNRVGLEPEEDIKDTMTIELQRQSVKPDDEQIPRLMVKIGIANGQEIGYDSALFPIDDRINDLGWSGFESCDACRLIHDRIAYYADSLAAVDPDLFAQQIYVKAVRDTKIRIISFIMKECAEYRNKIQSVKVKML